jgi:DNA polymerase
MALIRSCICAGDKQSLVVADYKSIENRILAWVAGEDRIIDLFHKGLDEYIDFATELYGVKYEEVTKEQRTMCKPIILGAGYGLGWKGLLEYVRGWGIDFSDRQAQEGIEVYRQGHSNIRKFWYAGKDCAVNAILYSGETFEYNNCRFTVRQDRNKRKWLILLLPSGRPLYYPDPEIREDAFGAIPTHMGIHPKHKKWSRLKLIPGRITENIVQALARDILVNGKKELESEGFSCILSVHDEVLAVEHEEFDDMDSFCKIMCRLPNWAGGLPLDAEGVITKRYYKI